MLKIVICDDEKEQRNYLKNMISTHLELRGIDYMITEFESGEELIASINSSVSQYDIVFLDIEMNEINGVEVARNLRACDKKLVIIFVTAYSNFVFQGYEVKALNYILKPYKKEKLIHVLNEALEQIEEMVDKFYIIETRSGLYKLNLNEIFYFASDKRKVRVFINQNVYELYGKLDDIEKQLPAFYVRLHQRYLVNINFVSAIEGNVAYIRDERLPISRKRYNEVIISFAKTMLE